MGHHGELTVDQAHRGYSIATDAAGFQSVNPLFWKPARNAITKEFAGQRTYGYLSFEAFVEAAARCNAHLATPADYDGALPTMATTAGATAILEAGRKSLDAGDGRLKWFTRARRRRCQLQSELLSMAKDEIQVPRPVELVLCPPVFGPGLCKLLMNPVHQKPAERSRSSIKYMYMYL